MKVDVERAHEHHAEKPEPVCLFDKETHTYTVDGKVWPSITQVISLVDRIYTDTEAAEDGSIIHALTAHYDNGTLTDEMLRKYNNTIQAKVRGWIKFVDEAGFEPTFVELPMFNHRHRYAGTPDRVGTAHKIKRIGGPRRDAIFEIKSGGVSRVACLQLAAQEALVKLNYGYHALPRYVVQLQPDNYRLMEYKGTADFNIFLALLKAKHWQMEIQP